MWLNLELTLIDFENPNSLTLELSSANFPNCVKLMLLVSNGYSKTIT